MGRSVASSSSKQHPSYRLLEQNGFQQEAYEQYRRRCIKERKAVGKRHSSCSLMHNNSLFCAELSALESVHKATAFDASGDSTYCFAAPVTVLCGTIYD